MRLNMIKNAESPTSAAPSLTGRLREATADHHVRAEKHALQQALVRGQADALLYARWLRAMRALHTAFEARLAMARSHAVIAPVIQDHHFRLDMIDEDLDALAVLLRQAGADLGPAVGASESRDGAAMRPRTLAAWTAIDAMIEIDPTVVLGPFYVLEGSTNGGRFIAMAVRKALPLPSGAGTKFLDPHGEHIRERWAATKQAIDSIPLSASQHDAIIDAAQRTFDLVTVLMDEMVESAGP